MIRGLLALLCCQLAGEFLVRLLDVPVPGPVVGMVILLGWFQLRDPAPDSAVVEVCEGLLKHMSLLFVPAGAGVMQYLGLLGASAVPVVVGLAVSWAAGLVATALVMTGLLALARRRGRGRGDGAWQVTG